MEHFRHKSSILFNQKVFFYFLITWSSLPFVWLSQKSLKVLVRSVPWVCGGRYRPVLCSVSPPDYLSLLTSSHPWEDRDKVQGCHLNINNYFQDWSYLAAVVAVLLVSQLRSTFPPLANTALCPHCRTGELATPWRAGCSVVEETMTPLHLASLGLMPAGRPQLHC